MKERAMVQATTLERCAMCEWSTGNRFPDCEWPVCLSCSAKHVEHECVARKAKERAMDELTVQKRPNGYRLTARGCDSSTVINLDHSATEALVKLLVQHWTGGPIPAEGMVLVDAQTLRKAITRVQAKDALHPAGECRCGYQGECAWCQMDEWRNRATTATEREASIRKRWSELGDIYNAERERRQLAEKVIADLRLTIDRMRAAAAMAPEGLDSVHVAVSPEAVDEVLDGVDQDERPTCATVGGETGSEIVGVQFSPAYCNWSWTCLAPPPPHTEAPGIDHHELCDCLTCRFGAEYDTEAT